MWSASFIVILAAAGDFTSHPDLTSPDEVIFRMDQALHAQSQQLCRYTVQRRYSLRNRHLAPNAGMTVVMKYEEKAGKSFTVTGSEHLGSVSQTVLHDFMEEERTNSREQNPRSEINPQHYLFSMSGIEERNGRRCYRISLKPRERSSYLLDGTAWIDTAEFALVHIEGRSAKSVSFWLGRPFVQLDYQKVGRFWLPLHNRSVAQVKLAGETQMDVESFNYQFPDPICSNAVTPPAKPLSGQRLLRDTPEPMSPEP